MINLRILKRNFNDKLTIFNSLLIFISIIFMASYFIYLSSITNYKLKLAEGFNDASYIENIGDDELNKLKKSFPDIDYDFLYHTEDSINKVFCYSGTRLSSIPGSYYEIGFKYAFMDNVELINGELFDPNEAGKMVIIDYDEAMRLYNNLNVVGSSYYLEDKKGNRINLKIVGVAKNSTVKKTAKNSKNYNAIYLPFNIYDTLYNTSNYDLLINDKLSAADEKIIINLLSLDKIQNKVNNQKIIIQERNDYFISNLIIIMVPFITGMLGLCTYLIYKAMDLKDTGVSKAQEMKNYTLDYLIQIIIVNAIASIIGLIIGLIFAKFNDVGFIIDFVYLFWFLLIALIIIPLIFLAMTLIPTIIVIFTRHSVYDVEGSDLIE